MKGLFFFFLGVVCFFNTNKITIICSGQIEICKTCMNPKFKLAPAALNNLSDFCADGHIMWGVQKLASRLPYSLTGPPPYGSVLDYTHSSLAPLNATGPPSGSISPKFMLHSQKKTNMRIRQSISEMTQRERFSSNFGKLSKV